MNMIIHIELHKISQTKTIAHVDIHHYSITFIMADRVNVTTACLKEYRKQDLGEIGNILWL